MMRSWIKGLSVLLLSVGLVFGLSACKTHSGKPADKRIMGTLAADRVINRKIDAQAAQKLPVDVSAALQPGINAAKPQQESDQTDSRFDIAVENASVREFYMGLVKGTPYNMMVSPKVQGTISLPLKQVTIPEILEAVRDLYGYEYKATPYGFVIEPPQLQTRVFPINYLDVKRDGQSRISVNSGQLSKSSSTESSETSSTETTTEKEENSSSIRTTTASDFWKSLGDSLQTMVGADGGRQVVLNSDASIVVVTAYPDELRRVTDYLGSLMDSAQRQVILEAKIIEVILNDGYQAGINWKLLGAEQDGYKDLNDEITDFSNIFTVSASLGQNFNTVVRLLSDQGNVQVLSSPRISTLNNQKAVIKVGQDEFFVTDVSSSTSGSTAVTEVTQDLELTPFFSGIALDVTPQIDGQGGVLLQIHPVVSEVSDQEKDFEVSGEQQKLPLALTKIRESDNIVYAQNGQIVVIGGLMEDRTSEFLASVPVLGKLPLVGTFFRDTKQTSQKSELVILLRPIIIERGTWTKEVGKLHRAYGRLRKGFHYGDHPKVFGNTAEKPLMPPSYYKRHQ